MKAVFLLLLLALTYVSAQLTTLTSFSARVAISAPTISGRVTGTLHYDRPNNKILIVYDFTTFPLYELYDHTPTSQGQVRYIWCPNDCDADNLGTPIPDFTATGATAAGTEQVRDRNGNLRTCSRYTRTNDAVTSLSFDAEGPCRMAFADGREYRFDTGSKTFNAAAFAGTPPSYCPAKSCGIKLDLYQVLDESGSISSTEWNQLRNFARDVVDGFRFDANTGVGMGVVTFSSGSSIDGSTQIRSSLSFSQNNVRNIVINMNQRGGSTCIGCGSDVAIRNRAGSSNRRSTATKAQIVVTDGANNRYESLMNNYPIWRGNSAGGADYRNWIFFSIGIGSDAEVDVNQLNNIAGSTSRVFRTPSFAGLQQLVNSIITQTCVLDGSFSCPNCAGFCVPVGCNGPCICADCQDNNICTFERCDNPTIGCIYPVNPCNDADECTYDSCDYNGNNGAGRCVNTPKIPNQGDCGDIGVPVGQDNLCTVDGCRSSSGCFHDFIQCVDGNACTDDSCNPSVGCVFTPNNRNCLQCNQTGIPVDCSAIQDQFKCDIIACDPTVQVLPQNYPNPTLQCKSSGPKVCNDSDPCTIDRCDPLTGGCIYERVNETLYCNDNDFCTVDTCVSSMGGCINTRLTCSDGDNCTLDLCDPATGLTYDRDLLVWTGCSNPALNCDDGNICTVDTCISSLGGCVHSEKDCSLDPVLGSIVSSCYQAFCDPFTTAELNTTLFVSEGCYLEQIVNTTVNECGRCCGSDLIGQELADCVSGAGCSKDSTEADSLAVGGLFLAAILIAIIAICVVAGLLGGKKGYDIYLRNKGAMTGANTSPLYTADGLTGTNALYEAPSH